MFVVQAAHAHGQHRRHSTVAQAGLSAVITRLMVIVTIAGGSRGVPPRSMFLVVLRFVGFCLFAGFLGFSVQGTTSAAALVLCQKALKTRRHY